MGIQGLLPFLKKIHTPVNVSQFKGCTVAIDAYCWLHKGAFSCADKLALGEKTEQYVYYCMKYVDCLLRSGLKPILVFDGCHLPSKKDVETSRRERREMNRKRAAQLLREGKRTEAKECLQRCVDITPQMALELMNVCRARGVDCIVAPYEADSQLAYLNKAGIAQIIITEDSDLLLFGCEKVIFKMDFYGNGVLIEQSRLNEVVDIQDGFYTFDKFRYMCILSGCDYLPSLPGIGLAKACKVFKVARQTDIRQLLKKLPSYLKMNLVVTDEYTEGFIRADNTFLYQLAFDPLTRKLCPLTPYPPEVEIEELKYAGPYFSNQRALQIALGNIDIHTHEKIADFDPQTFIPKYAKKQDNEMLHMLSIWKRGYRPRPGGTGASTLKTEDDVSSRPCLAGKEVQVKNTVTKRTPVKRGQEVPDSMDTKTDTELADMYSAPKPQRKRKRDSDESSVQPPAPASPKSSNPFDSDDDSDDLKSKRSVKKLILSPSKLINQPTPRPIMSADDAFSLMDQESARLVVAEGKENDKKTSVAPGRNKFAVSALVKRAKFSLDAPLPNVKVEFKSRYFSSTPGSSASSPSAHKSTTSENKTSVVEKNAGNSSHKGQGETSADDSSPTSSKTHQSDMNKSSSRDNLEQTSISPIVPEKNTSLLTKFGYSSEKSDNKTQTAKSTGSTKTTECARQGSSSLSKKSSKCSPSAFSWSSFKFAKSNSTPAFSSLVHTSANSNKPFKRVSSENKCDGEGLSSQKSDVPDSRGDMGSASVDDLSDVSHCSRLFAAPGDDGDSATDLDCSQRSGVDMESSQRSNLYSIDSDCFPNSQDFVDLTDCETDSQNNGDRTSPSSSQSLKLPARTPRTTSGAGTKKCRVSGLSRSKKKTAPGVDEKQQKIQDMFSRFAHSKASKLECTPKTGVGEDHTTGCETPASLRLRCPTEAHRKLFL